MIDMTLIRPITKAKVDLDILVPIDFLIYDFNSNYCSRTHRLATIHNVTDDRQTDGRNTVT